MSGPNHHAAAAADVLEHAGARGGYCGGQGSPRTARSRTDSEACRAHLETSEAPARGVRGAGVRGGEASDGASVGEDGSLHAGDIPPNSDISRSSDLVCSSDVVSGHRKIRDGR